MRKMFYLKAFRMVRLSLLPSAAKAETTITSTYKLMIKSIYFGLHDFFSGNIMYIDALMSYLITA